MTIAISKYRPPQKRAPVNQRLTPRIKFTPCSFHPSIVLMSNGWTNEV